MGTNQTSNDVSLLLGDGQGALGTATNTVVDTSPAMVAVVNVNGNGNGNKILTSTYANPLVAAKQVQGPEGFFTG